MMRIGGQRVFTPGQLDQRLRTGLIGHWIGGGSGRTWFDQSGYGNHGTLTDGVVNNMGWSLGQGGKRQALRCTDTDTRVLIPTLSASGAKSLALWINWVGTPNSVIMSDNALGTTYLLFADSTDFYINSVGGFSSKAHGGFSLGQWYHIGLSSDGTTITWFKNGVSLGTSTNRDVSVTSIGGSSGGIFGVIGLLDDVRLYNRRLSDAEMALLASPSFSPVVMPYRLNAFKPPVIITGSGASSFSMTVAGVGTADITGSGATNFTMTSAGTGAADGIGSGASTATFTAAATSQVEIAATGSALFTFTPEAVSLADKVGSGATSFTFTPEAIGAADIAGAGAASFTVAVAGVGSGDTIGTGATAVTMTVAGTGAADGIGSGASSFTLTAVGAGVGVGTSSGASVVTFAAAATGQSHISGTGVASFSVTTAAVGQTHATGTGAVSFSFSTTGGGQTDQAPGTAAFSVAVAGVGRADGISSGSVSCSFSVLGTSPGVSGRLLGLRRAVVA